MPALTMVDGDDLSDAYASNVRTMCWRYFPKFLAQRERARTLNTHIRNDKAANEPFIPRGHGASEEYRKLGEISHTPYLRLVHQATVQQLVVNGVRSGSESSVWTSDSSSLHGYFGIWQQNRFDRGSNMIHHATVGHGVAYCVAGWSRHPLTGERYIRWTPLDATQCIAFYASPTDEWAEFALIAQRIEPDLQFPDREAGWLVRFIDARSSVTLRTRGDGGDPKDWAILGAPEEHGASVPPVVSYLCNPDTLGNSTGEVEPYIPLAARIDQTKFDRLIVQRYGAWKIRYVTGLSRPAKGTEEAAQLKQMMEQIRSSRDIMFGFGDKMNFGAIPETQLEGFIAAGMSDLRDLSATSQTPPYHLLGMSDNLQAESLAAAASAQDQKCGLIRVSVGESHESLLRLTGHMVGDTALERAYDLQVRWKDMQVRSMTQAADALAKLVQVVGVPQEMAFEMIEGWTDADVQRAMELVESKQVDQMINALTTSMMSTTQQPAVAPAQQGETQQVVQQAAQ